jgi:hypothetical protein
MYVSQTAPLNVASLETSIILAFVALKVNTTDKEEVVTAPLFIITEGYIGIAALADDVPTKTIRAKATKLKPKFLYIFFI